MPRPRPHDESFRHFLCERAACAALVALCSHCDRGDRYCSVECAVAERARKHREANARYARKHFAKAFTRLRVKRFREQPRPRADLVTDHRDEAPAC